MTLTCTDNILIRKITYVAKHNSGGNDDEGAIASALRTLGIEVVCLSEGNVTASDIRSESFNSDLVLFHKWSDFNLIRAIKIPKVFWYFDLVEYPDPTLYRRCYNRVSWMREVLPLVDIGFCTDGDWVCNRTHGYADKLVTLKQGFDSRLCSSEAGSTKKTSSMPVLFTGISKGGGQAREEWVENMTSSFPNFMHISSGVYREELCSRISNSLVYVCPPTPVTDRYWSNRVYQGCGMRGIVLHGYSYGLSQEYENGKDLLMYSSQRDLVEIIHEVKNSPETFSDMSQSAYFKTMQKHTYTHRVKQLLQICQTRMKIKGHT